MPVAEGFRTWVRCPPPPPFAEVGPPSGSWISSRTCRAVSASLVFRDRCASLPTTSRATHPRTPVDRGAGGGGAPQGGAHACYGTPARRVLGDAGVRNARCQRHHPSQSLGHRVP